MEIKLSYIVFTLASLFLIASCSDMNDLHDKYLNEREIVYAAKVDSFINFLRFMPDI